MDISKTREGNQLTVKLVGELNSASAPALAAMMKSELSKDDTVVFDVTDLTYMSSAGLRVLVACEKATGARGAVTLHGVNEAVDEILKLAGFDSFLVIE